VAPHMRLQDAGVPAVRAAKVPERSDPTAVSAFSVVQLSSVPTRVYVWGEAKFYRSLFAARPPTESRVIQ